MDGSVYVGVSPDDGELLFTTVDTDVLLDYYNIAFSTSDLESCRPAAPGGSHAYVDGTEASCSSGQENSEQLLSIAASESTDFLPITHCSQLERHGQSDWYLPSYDETYILMSNEPAIGGSNSGKTWHWTSSFQNFDGTYYNFWQVSLAGAVRYSGTGAFPFVDYSVRCMRKGYVPPVTCSSPNGRAGDIVYNQDNLVMQYCNGNDWVAMGPVGGTGGGGCISPAGNAGDIMFNTDYNTMQFCNAQDWVAIGKQTPPTDGLIAHWTLDDTSGSSIIEYVSANNGAWTDNTDNDVTDEAIKGKFGGGLVFDGTDDRIVVASDSGYDIATGGSFSQFVWFKKTTDCGANAGGDNEVFASRWGSGFTNRTWWLGCDVNTDELEINFYGSAGSVSVTGPVIDDGVWHHGGWVYDGSEVRLYLDGALAGSQSYTLDAAMDVANPICIGSYDNTCTDSRFFFDGELDDVRIYNKALTETEIKQLYYATK